ncbi:MAG: hypothetical protein OEW33_07375 [Nitrospirota bacterium]|nr:hypothetical protein [Nitrospirota bacterium]
MTWERGSMFGCPIGNLWWSSFTGHGDKEDMAQLPPIAVLFQ